ncbi:MAG TPA: PhoU domain-containing protein [Planctomycetota bacterium]|nr:PhoU domain-containing protein [Planctomycetota bacterium]
MTNPLLEVRMESLRESLEKLAAAVDDNLRSVLLKLTCDKAVSAGAPFVSVDELARTVRERCLLLLAREHPMAGDLKFAMAALRVGHDYERVNELAQALIRRIEKLTGTPVQDLMQDMTGVMADILKLHEIVRRTWLRDRGHFTSEEIKPQVAAHSSVVGSQISVIQNKIMEAIARGGNNAEIFVEVVLACRHLKRIATTLESIPDELNAFDKAA